MATSSAQEAADSARGPTAWRTGTDLQKHLKVTLSVEWKETELRPRLETLSADQRTAIFLDRRIDPNQKIDFARTGMPLAALFDELAQTIVLGSGTSGAMAAPIGPVMYIGPPPTASVLAATLAQKRKELSRRPALARVRPQPLAWDELAEPRELLLEVARRHSLTVVNPEAVPHDLWPAGDFPPLSLGEQLTLLLAGFDLTFELSSDGGELRLVPLEVDTQRTAVVRRPGSQGTTAKGTSEDNIRFTLTVTNGSAGAVVNKVAERLSRQIECSASVREKLATKINLKVSDATLEELLDKTLSPLGLSYRLTKETLEVVDKP